MKKIMLCLMLGVFLISLTSAMTFDNVKNFDKDIGTYGKIMVSYWKSSARKISYSDDRGSSWTEVSV